MAAHQVRWPTKSLAKTISKIGIAVPPTSVPLGQGLVDVTPDSSVGRQIIQFAPRIRLVGQELITESQSHMWGGVLVRVLESRHEEKKRRCIQYLYVYTLQRSSVSVFYNIIVPLLIAGLAFFSPLVFGIQDDSGLLAILVWAVCIPLFLLAVLPHLSDWIEKTKKGFHIRGTTWLLIFAVLSGVLVLRFHGSFTGLLDTLITGCCIVYWGSFAIFTVAAILCFFGRGIGCHRMDYTPVFVYLREEDSGWRIESACWDYFHYQAVCMPASTKGLLSNGPRVQLIMTDPWHALSRGSVVNSRLGTIIGLLLLIILTLIPPVWIAEGLPQFLEVLIMLLLFVTGALLAAQTPIGGGRLSNLQRLLDAKYLESVAHLNSDKLTIFWSLDDPDADLEIKSKLQDPFVNYPQKDGSFHDS